MVNAVDSREEQTEWKRAENEAQFMKMWEEVGVTPKLASESPWATKMGPGAEVTWSMDSDFAPSDADSSVNSNQSAPSSDVYGHTSSAVPNIAAMSDKQFESYLKKLRQMRPEFASYLKEVATRRAEKEGVKSGPADSTAGFTSFWEHSEKPSAEYRHFLGSQAYKAYSSPGSRAIEQQPQTYGGLHYAKHPELQDQFLNRARPGRLVIEGIGNGGNPWWGVIFAGHNATISNATTVPSGHLDFKQLMKPGEHDTQAGVAKFRITQVMFNYPPQTVGQRPGGLAQARMETRVRVENEADMSRSNTHRPGSPAYVGQSQRKLPTDGFLTYHPKSTAPQAPARESSPADVLLTLRNLVGNKKRT